MPIFLPPFLISEGKQEPHTRQGQALFVPHPLTGVRTPLSIKIAGKGGGISIRLNERENREEKP
jgi:hypothetical protein